MSDYVIDQERPHLGGYLAGGDEATIYPDLWDWLVDELGVKRVIDVGCGEGHALQHFRERGCRVRGLDGMPQDDPDIFEHDYTTGAYRTRRSDMVWCCEFVEHVEEQYVPNFLKTFEKARLVFLTHATPGQAGHHHVNNQPAAYWKGALAAVGFTYDRELTVTARARAALNTHPSNHFARSGMVFKR